MGVHQNISKVRFPKQGMLLNREVSVYFGEETSDTVPAIVVRCDAQPPWVTLLELADGRFVLATECRFRVKTS